MRMRSILLLVIPMALLSLIGAIQKPTEQQLKTEWSAFLADYDAAYKAWLKPYTDAKTDEERNKVKLDFEKMPAKAFLPKAVAFAQKAKGSEVGASAWIWVFSYAGQTQASGAQKRALDALLADYITSPKIAQLAQTLQYGGPELSQADAEAALKTILEKSPEADVRAQALASLAGLNMPYEGSTEAQRAAAETYLGRLMAEYPSSRAAAQARGALFELKNLQIGMPAPDFEATDEKGNKFKLSDYRGKVVIVDFWGFW